MTSSFDPYHRWLSIPPEEQPPDFYRLLGLRQFEGKQRRAAREQILAQVTARMRESLDMETVLRTAVAEMRQALELEGVIVQLARPEETAPVADEVGTQGPAV